MVSQTQGDGEIGQTQQVGPQQPVRVADRCSLEAALVRAGASVGAVVPSREALLAALGGMPVENPPWSATFAEGAGGLGDTALNALRRAGFRVEPRGDGYEVRLVGLLWLRLCRRSDAFPEGAAFWCCGGLAGDAWLGRDTLILSRVSQGKAEVSFQGGVPGTGLAWMLKRWARALARLPG